MSRIATFVTSDLGVVLIAFWALALPTLLFGWAVNDAIEMEQKYEETKDELKFLKFAIRKSEAEKTFKKIFDN